EAQELAFVRLDDRADEPALGELDGRHLRGADNRRGHRRDHLRVHPVGEGVGHDEAVSPDDGRGLDVRHPREFVDRLLEAHPDVGHAATSAALRISAIDWTALSTLRRRRPMFASFRTMVTRIASSPAPVAIIFPMCVSTMDELKAPRPISTTAISDVPTIAAAIAAIFFGSIVFGRAWAIRIPSRRAIVAPRTAGIRRSSVRMPCRIFVASPSISSHPDDHLGEDQEGVPHAPVLRGDRRAHPVDADRFLGDRLDDRRLPGVERARDEDAREIDGQSNEVAERIRDPVRPDSVRLHLRDAHRVADDSAAEGRLKLDDEVGHRADLVEFALHQGPVDEEEADDRPGRAGRLDQLAPEPEDVLLGEPVHEELHRVDDDAAGPLRLHRGEDRFADRREAVDVVDVVLLTAREEELGRRRVDEHELRRIGRSETFQFPAGELRGAEEVHVQAGLSRLDALDREVLAEQALLRRLVAEQEERGRSGETSLKPLVEDRDPGLRARGHRLRGRLHQSETTASGSCANGCHDASTWYPRMWCTRTSCPMPSVKRISTTPSTRDRKRFIVIGSWTPSWTAYR